MPQRGNIDLDQIRDSVKSGQGTGTKIVTGFGNTTPGNGGIWDADGNWIDSGAPAETSGTSATHTEVLTDSTGVPIVTSTGDWIYVLGVPN